MNSKITTIAFDADDTLWINEPYFREAEQQFCRLLEDYQSHETISGTLFATEMKNLHLYGYGVKGFILCMLETAGSICGPAMSAGLTDAVIALGHDLLEKPITLLPGVLDTLEQLNSRYRLVLATKGDLLDQERKLHKSGLEQYFQYTSIMSDKKRADYRKLMQHLSCEPSQFMMVGNSVRSDILPVLELGGYGGYIPFHMTWAHEQEDLPPGHNNFMTFQHFDDLLNYLQ